MIYGNKLYYLNNTCGADYLMFGVSAMVRRRFDKEHLIGVEMGTAYGGGVEGVGKMWKGIGEVHAFDTFEGHPEFLSSDENSHEKTCMRRWYTNQYEGKWRIPHLTPEMLTYDYQRRVLDEQGLDNVILHKGLVNKDSLKDISHVHYALLDMDLVVSMNAGYDAVKDKIVKGGFLCLHDVIPDGHIKGLYEFYQDILRTGQYKVIINCGVSYLIVLEKI